MAMESFSQMTVFLSLFSARVQRLGCELLLRSVWNGFVRHMYLEPRRSRCCACVLVFCYKILFGFKILSTTFRFLQHESNQYLDTANISPASFQLPIVPRLLEKYFCGTLPKIVCSSQNFVFRKTIILDCKNFCVLMQFCTFFRHFCAQNTVFLLFYL